MAESDVRLSRQTSELGYAVQKLLDTATKARKKERGARRKMYDEALDALERASEKLAFASNTFDDAQEV